MLVLSLCEYAWRTTPPLHTHTHPPPQPPFAFLDRLLDRVALRVSVAVLLRVRLPEGDALPTL